MWVKKCHFAMNMTWLILFLQVAFYFWLNMIVLVRWVYILVSFLSCKIKKKKHSRLKKWVNVMGWGLWKANEFNLTCLLHLFLLFVANLVVLIQFSSMKWCLKRMRIAFILFLFRILTNADTQNIGYLYVMRSLTTVE